MKTQFSQHVSVRYPLELLELLQTDYGLSRQELAQAYELCSPDVEMPEGFVPVEVHQQICEMAIQKVNDPWMGINLGRHMTSPRFGVLGAAASSCQTALDMLKLMESFAGTLLPINSDIRVGSERVYMEYSLPQIFESELEFHVQVTTTSSLKLLEDAVGYLPRNIRIYLPISKSEGYIRHFPYRLEFNHPQLAIDWPLNYLMNPLLSSDPAARKLFLQACASIASQLKSSRTLGSSIDQLLSHCEYRYPSLEQVADRMHVTTRTLRNRLAREDLSYRDMVKRHRLEQAKHMLKNNDKTVDDISEVLGYSTTGSFCRAFKRETGTSPSCYRRDAI